MSKNFLTTARLRTIRLRQEPLKWGSQYVPAQLATVAEGPSLGELSTFRSRLIGRRIHCLSRGERAAALLALHHPKVFDLQEQFMLSPTAAPHPLAVHSRFPISSRLMTRGTLAIAHSLGALAQHPIVVDDSDFAGNRAVPFPYLGDFRLLFLIDSQPFLLNWSVRTTGAAFDIPVDPDKSMRNSKKKTAEEQLRHEIERIYHADLEIPTHRVESDRLPEILRSNLERACLADASTIQLNETQIAKAEDAIYAAFESRTPPLEVAVSLARSDASFTNQAIRTVLWQLIWRRALRADLWSPVFFDQPLRPEKVDVLEHFSPWFGGQFK